jgi:hypothetical protein
MNLHTRIGDGVNKSRNRSVRKTAEEREDIKEREETKQPEDRYVVRQIQHASSDAPCMRIQCAIPPEVLKLGRQTLA